MTAASSFEFEIEIEDMVNQDRVLLVPAGAGAEAALRTVNPMSSVRAMTAPSETGAYELLAWDGANGIEMARRPISVAEGEIRFVLPESVLASHGFSASWEGPLAPGDHIYLARSGTPDGESLLRQNASGGSRDWIAPPEPGDYELRYASSANRGEIIGRAVFRVTPFAATLSGPEEVEPGEIFDISWTAPGARADRIHIALPDAPVGEYVYNRSAAGRDGRDLRAPDMPGDYEIRYIGAYDALLARLPLRVVAAP